MKIKQRRIREVLGRIRHDVSMDNASFSRNVLLDGDAPLPTSESEVTEFIRNRTRLWRQSWIDAPLEEVLELLKEDGPVR